MVIVLALYSDGSDDRGNTNGMTVWNSRGSDDGGGGRSGGCGSQPGVETTAASCGSA